MTEIKLNRQKSYGTVYGDPRIGFVQDRLEFRHDGTLFSSMDVSPPAVIELAPAQAAAPESKPAKQESQKAEAKSEPIEEVGSLADRSAEALRRSEKMRQVWAQRRAAQEAADAEIAQEALAEPATPELPSDAGP